jgi:hypothetical protein
VLKTTYLKPNYQGDDPMYFHVSYQLISERWDLQWRSRDGNKNHLLLSNGNLLNLADAVRDFAIRPEWTEPLPIESGAGHYLSSRSRRRRWDWRPVAIGFVAGTLLSAGLLAHSIAVTRGAYSELLAATNELFAADCPKTILP